MSTFIYTKIFFVLLFVTCQWRVGTRLVYGGNELGERVLQEKSKTFRQSNWDCVLGVELESDFQMCCLDNCKMITCVTHRDLGTYKTFNF